MKPHADLKAFLEAELEYGLYEDIVLPAIERFEDPYAELKAAAKDPTKQIRIKGHKWIDAGEFYWQFDAPVERYEIRDKPAPKQKKKLRMNCYFTGTQLMWLTEAIVEKEWARVPFEDRIIEVEE
jgi:hypothetical protein